MNILVTGATGLIGRSLVPVLIERGYAITVLGRSENKIKKIFSNAVSFLTWDQLDSASPNSYDVVIHLAGENIADRRWSVTVKKKILDSRTQSTTKLIKWCLLSTPKKLRIFSASAIGVYGMQTQFEALAYTETTDVTSGLPNSFLAEVGRAWEKAADRAVNAGFAVTFLRFAVVLKKGQGILGKLVFPFSLGAGMVLGSGLQKVSWIHVDDLVRAIQFLLDHPKITGPVNLVAPGVISQAEFSRTLAHILIRPLFLTLPSGLIKILFGEMGEELLLGSQTVSPQRLLEAGFLFKYPELHSALKVELKK